MTSLVQSQDGWVTKEQVVARLGAEAPKDASGQVTLDDSMQAAVELLYSLSGRQYPGTVSAVVRPTSKPAQVTDMMWNRNLLTAGFGYAFGWNPSWMWGLCAGCGYGAGCCGPTSIGLGRSPIIGINEVMIDGEVIDPSEYRIDDGKWLVRQVCCDGWPTCQDMSCPLGEPNTFGVDFKFGQNPPVAGQIAATILASEFYKAATPGLACSLPTRITSITRQGISFAILDPQTFLTDGLTGNYQVDLFIKAYNPNKQIRRPMVWSPDIANIARRDTTPTVQPTGQ